MNRDASSSPVLPCQSWFGDGGWGKAGNSIARWRLVSAREGFLYVRLLTFSAVRRSKHSKMSNFLHVFVCQVDHNVGKGKVGGPPK
jgi:hypothetical protein